MAATAVIEEIEHLPPDEKSQVIRYALELARSRQLSGKALAELAQGMVDSKDPAEKNEFGKKYIADFTVTEYAADSPTESAATSP